MGRCRTVGEGDKSRQTEGQTERKKELSRRGRAKREGENKDKEKYSVFDSGRANKNERQ